MTHKLDRLCIRYYYFNAMDRYLTVRRCDNKRARKGSIYWFKVDCPRCLNYRDEKDMRFLNVETNEDENKELGGDQ